MHFHACIVPGVVPVAEWQGQGNKIYWSMQVDPSSSVLGLLVLRILCITAVSAVDDSITALLLCLCPFNA